MTAFSIPEEPDRARMYRDVGAKIRAAMTDCVPEPSSLSMN